MDPDKFDAILDMSDPHFTEKLADALGLAPGERLNVITPQFTRTDGLAVAVSDIGVAQLPGLSEESLKALGFAKWDEPNPDGDVLWLYPGEWYSHIPDGHPVTCIDGQTSPWRAGEMDDDTRFGMLAYGFMRRESSAQEPLP